MQPGPNKPWPNRSACRAATDVALYVATMSDDLAAMARRHGLDTLGYLLEMVKLEAEHAAGPSRILDDD